MHLGAELEARFCAVVADKTRGCITGSLLRVTAAPSAAVHAASVVAAAAVDTSKKPKELGFTMPGTPDYTCSMLHLVDHSSISRLWLAT